MAQIGLPITKTQTAYAPSYNSALSASVISACCVVSSSAASQPIRSGRANSNSGG
jgi:hypothetical protein